MMGDSKLPTSGNAVDGAEADWRLDPSADERWQAGCDFAMVQLCQTLGVDPKSVSWDAATETLDGDVCAVIWNILRAKMGDDWDPHAAPQKPAPDAMREALKTAKDVLRDFMPSGPLVDRTLKQIEAALSAPVPPPDVLSYGDMRAKIGLYAMLSCIGDPDKTDHDVTRILCEYEVAIREFAGKPRLAALPPPDGLATAILNSLEEVAKYLRRANPATIDIDGITEILITGIKQLRPFFSPSDAGAAEPAKLYYDYEFSRLIRQSQATAAEPDDVRSALKTALEEIVLVISFLSRDLGTERLAGTIKSLIARLSKADVSIRAALRSDPVSAAPPVRDRTILAATIHKARFPADRIATEFSDEDASSRAYCFRIADAILSLPVQSGVGERWPKPFDCVPRDGSWIIARCNDHSEMYKLRFNGEHWDCPEASTTFGDGLFLPNGDWIPDFFSLSSSDGEGR